MDEIIKKVFVIKNKEDNKTVAAYGHRGKAEEVKNNLNKLAGYERYKVSKIDKKEERD